MPLETRPASARDSAPKLESHYDLKIQACYAEIRRLREARNFDCSHTRKLPAEILSMIFSILSEDQNAIPGYPPLPATIGWVAVTHVCRSWRTIALDDPNLWCDLSHRSLPKRWLNEMFTRSKPAPLSLRLDREPSDSLKLIVEQVLEQPERLKALTTRKERYLHPLTKPVPYLERLTICDALLPPDFVGGHAPRLHYLDVSNVLVCLDAPWLCNLQTLHLSGNWSPKDQEGRSLSVKAFLECLSKLPHLVDLAVTLPPNMIATECPSSGTISPFSLNFLEINVGTSVAALDEILKFIVVESLRRFDIQLPYTTASVATTGKMINLFLATAQPDVLRWDIRSMDLVVSPHGDLHERTFRISPPIIFNSSAIHLPKMNIRTLGLTPCLSPTYFPLQDCRTIEELQVEGDDTLMALELLKHKSIPQLKSWIKERQKLLKLEELILENCGLTDNDVALLSKTISVVCR